MDFDLNLKAFLKGLKLGEMSGHHKFTALAAFNAHGKANVEVATGDVRARWPKSQMEQPYNPVFYERAQREGWVDRVEGKKGVFTIRQAGLDNLEALAKTNGPVSTTDLKKEGGLIVVNRKATHSFDKYLRSAFAKAKSEVLIADAYVDETIFDTVLDVISKTIPVKLLYGRAMGTFAARSLRFSKQWTQFASRRYKPLHDRFMVVDNVGYVLGPSIKDAALSSPAIVVELHPNEKKLLRNFFNELWQTGK